MLAKIQDLRSSLKLYGALALVPFVLMGCSTATYYAVHYNVHPKILCFPKELENEGGNTGNHPKEWEAFKVLYPVITGNSTTDGQGNSTILDTNFPRKFFSGQGSRDQGSSPESKASNRPGILRRYFHVFQKNAKDNSYPCVEESGPEGDSHMSVSNVVFSHPMPISAIFYDYLGERRRKDTDASAHSEKQGQALTEPREPKDEEAQFFGRLHLGIHLHIATELTSRDSADRLKWVFTFVAPLDPRIVFLYAHGTGHHHSSTDFGQFAHTGRLAPDYEGVGLGSLRSTLTQEIVRKYLHQSTTLIGKKTFGPGNPDRTILFVTQEGGPGISSLGGDSAVEAIMHVPAKRCKRVVIMAYKTHKPPGSWTRVDPMKSWWKKTTCYIPRIRALQVSIVVIRDVGCDLSSSIHWYSLLGNIVFPWRWGSAWHKCGRQTVGEGDDIVTPKAVGTVQVFDLWKNRHALYAVKHAGTCPPKESFMFTYFRDALRYVGEYPRDRWAIFRMKWSADHKKWEKTKVWPL